MTSGIYVVPLKDNSAFKVGRSMDIQERISKLSQHYELDLDSVWVIQYDEWKQCSRMEKALHDILTRHRVLFPFNGGTEFFAMEHYTATLEMCSLLATTHEAVFETIDVTDSSGTLFEWNEEHRNIQTIGESVRRKRLELNITQDQLSASTGVSRRTITRLEGGNGSTLESALKILNALGINEFVPFVESPERRRSR